jgi:hypothetical protein
MGSNTVFGRATLEREVIATDHISVIEVVGDKCCVSKNFTL